MKNIISLSLGILFTLNLAAQEGKISVEQPVVTNGDTVYGSLLSRFPLDEKAAIKQPLVIIIPGSGPTDRDGNSAMLSGPNNAFKQLSDSLLKAGVASYRYDKLGVGASRINRPESDFEFYDNVEVVKSIFTKMKELGFKDIYLLGHSEGSLVGMLAAQEVKADGFISLAGSGRNFYDLLKEQLENNLPENMQQSTMQKIDSIREGHTVEKYNPALHSLLRASVQPYLRSTFKYTPTEEIAQLKKPVLIIQGGNDVQVTEGDAEALAKAQPKAQYIFYPKMNHVLKMTDGSTEQNAASYYDPDFPLNPKLAVDISQWISKN